jgi:hypothetical protein
MPGGVRPLCFPAPVARMTYLSELFDKDSFPDLVCLAWIGNSGTLPRKRSSERGQPSGHVISPREMSLTSWKLERLHRAASPLDRSAKGVRVIEPQQMTQSRP